MPAATIHDALVDAAPRLRETPSELLVEIRLAVPGDGELRVDTAGVTACARDGVLTLRVPKAQRARRTLEGFHPEVPPI